MQEEKTFLSKVKGEEYVPVIPLLANPKSVSRKCPCASRLRSRTIQRIREAERERERERDGRISKAKKVKEKRKKSARKDYGGD